MESEQEETERTTRSSKNEILPLSNSTSVGLLSTNSLSTRQAACLVKPSHPYHAPRNRIVWLIYISLIIISNLSARKLAEHCSFQGHSLGVQKYVQASPYLPIIFIVSSSLHSTLSRPQSLSQPSCQAWSVATTICTAITRHTCT
jgi:hypothetical protein